MCLDRFIVEADLEQRQAALPTPKSCPSEPGSCRSTSFNHIEEESEHTDYQEIRVQEQVQTLSMGALPQSITVLLTDDLADSCKPGGEGPSAAANGVFAGQIHPEY